jgi:hypothetical protein
VVADAVAAVGEGPVPPPAGVAVTEVSVGEAVGVAVGEVFVGEVFVGEVFVGEVFVGEVFVGEFVGETAVVGVGPSWPVRAGDGVPVGDGVSLGNGVGTAVGVPVLDRAGACLPGRGPCRAGCDENTG